jgi:benzil reductase ((S)-benzoin forming)
MRLFFLTGASKGLGKALAEKILTYPETILVGLGRTAGFSHPNYRHYAIDLSDPEAILNFPWADYISQLKEKALLIETACLINNAGSVQPVGHIGELDNRQLQQSMQLNLLTPMLLTNEFIANFRSFVSGCGVINVSSGAAQRAVDGWGVYCTSKAGLEMWTRVLRLERETENSGFIAVAFSPGMIDTEMQAQIRQTNPADFSRQPEFMEHYRAGRLQTPEEAAAKFEQLLLKLNLLKK